MWGIRYEEFVMPLIKAVQELSTKNDSLVTTVNALTARISRLESLMGNGTITSQSSADANAISLSDKNTAILGQNAPNPFVKNTVIAYNLPSSVNHASINFYNLSGVLLKSVHITAG